MILIATSLRLYRPTNDAELLGGVNPRLDPGLFIFGGPKQ